MSRYIGLYVKTCDLCNRTKTMRRRPIGELHPTEIPEGRWDKVSVDFIVELPEAHGYDAVMNVVDFTSKRVHFIPTHTTLTAEGTARIFHREVWKHHGLPKSILSDHGPQFVADFTRELYRLLGIKLATSTAYHPQPDGQTERANQTVACAIISWNSSSNGRVTTLDTTLGSHTIISTPLTRLLNSIATSLVLLDRSIPLLSIRSLSRGLMLILGGDPRIETTLILRGG